MKAHFLVPAAVAGFVALQAAPATGEERVPVGPFRTIELHGGGRAILHYAPVQQVRIVEGSSRVSDIYLSDQSGDRGYPPEGERNRADDRLAIDACRERCPPNYRLVVEIDTPDFDGISTRGGGQIDLAPGFPHRDSLNAAISGGGTVDARSIAAIKANAAVNGGGDILLGRVERLAAAVSGGGRILYHGDPKVISAVRGGGVIERDDR
jgi:hypothetical protein